MLSKLQKLKPLIGNTPLVQLEHRHINLYAKLEYHNLMSSVKTRAAYHILEAGILRGQVTADTTLVESSSGNFAIAMATLCKQIGIPFIPVIDPNINESYETLLRTISPDVVKVTERDETGGYLLTRLATVQHLIETLPDAYWTNQYENEDNFQAHYHGIGSELAAHFDTLDYVFIGVSTGGTIAGISTRLKEAFPNVKVIAVDSQGSVIFGDTPRKRYIPGIGASIVPKHIHSAQIDEVMIVPETKTVQGCRELFAKHAIFAGGSSGTSYYAIQEYFKDKTLDYKPNVAFLCPDHGAPYINTVYNQTWTAWLHENSDQEQETRLCYT